MKNDYQNLIRKHFACKTNFNSTEDDYCKNYIDQQSSLEDTRKRMLNHIKQKISQPKKTRVLHLPTRTFRKYAAIFVIGMIGIAALYEYGDTLRFSISGIQNDNSSSKSIYVPNGETFELVLSDGTKIYLNAGSSITYPLKFIENRNREVTLVGEAYFEVTEDKLSPFIVNVKDTKVKVLGTSFNVSSYPEEINVTTTLIEGSVALYNNSDDYHDTNGKFLMPIKTLLPNQKATWNSFENKLSVEDVDGYDYIAWRKGELIFRAQTFREILVKLERHYNVSIESKNESLNNQVFSASFGKEESISAILSTFQKNFPFNFSLNEKVITISN